MTLEEIYYISQIVASVAVLASLIYLAVQTRQNTVGQRALMHQQRILQMQSDLHVRADPVIAAAQVAAEPGNADMTEVQLRQFIAMTLSGLTSMEEQFRLHRAGQYDAAHWATTKKTLAVYLRTPGARVIARMFQGMFDPDFAAILDQLIGEARVQPHFDRRAMWNAMMEEELRLSAPAKAAP
jgi:hypothetical protein